MPSSVYPDELAKMLLKHCPVPGLVERVWPRLQTLIRRAYSDTYPLSPAGILDEERVRSAIAEGFRTKADAVRFISMSSKAPLKGLDMEEMINHVARSLTTNRRNAFRALAAHDADGSFQKEYFKELGNPMMESFFTEHWRAFMGSDSMETTMMIMSTPAFYLFFLLGHLFAGDEADVDAMLPLAEMMPFLVPVGEGIDELGTWTVLVK